jgi:hypothetical protein
MTKGRDEPDTPLEAPEGDVAEQQTSVQFSDADSDDPVPVTTSYVEADEADLLEQARVVPIDEEDV